MSTVWRGVTISEKVGLQFRHLENCPRLLSEGCRGLVHADAYYFER